MPNKHATQGEQLIDFIRRCRDSWGYWPTYMALLKTGISTAPHKRLAEPAATRALRRGEVLKRGINDKGLTVFMIVTKAHTK